MRQPECGSAKLALALIISSLSITIPARAQAAPPLSDSQHVATVNFTAAVMQTSEAKREFAALQAKYAPRQARLESLSREIETLRNQLAQPSPSTSDADRNTRAQSLGTRQKQLQRDQEDFNTESQSEAEETFGRIAHKFDLFIESYAKQHGYWLVLDRGTADASPVVLYAIDSIDITTRLVSAYDAQSSSDVPSRPPG